MQNKRSQQRKPGINWSRVSRDDIKTYVDNTERILSGIEPSHNLLLCDNFIVYINPQSAKFLKIHLEIEWSVLSQSL